MSTITACIAQRPIWSAFGLSCWALVAGLAGMLVSAFSGQFDMTVPFNGIFLLICVSVFAYVRYGFYALVARGLEIRAYRTFAVLEIFYVFTVFFAGIDTIFPHWTNGGIVTVSYVTHFFLIPLSLLIFLVVLGVSFIMSKANNNRALILDNAGHPVVVQDLR